MIRLVLTDLDGTLINGRRELTEATRRALRSLREAGIGFTLVSGRPPLGMLSFLEELETDGPIAVFNGGMLIRPDLSILEQRHLDPAIAARVVGDLVRMGLDPWVYGGNEWLIRDYEAPHVAREKETVKFEPKIVASFEGHLDGVIKIVGVSDDLGLVQRAERELRASHSGRVTAFRSQDYYLDITHPEANKGAVVDRIAELLYISPTEIATLGDMPSDVEMFSRSGMSFAMGNASREVQAQAASIVPSNDHDGFAEAIQ